jgi:ariadne-1
MNNAIKKVAEIVNPSGTSNAKLRKLLDKYRWDTEKFLEEFYCNDALQHEFGSQNSESLDAVMTDAKDQKENKDPGRGKKKTFKTVQEQLDVIIIDHDYATLSPSPSQRITRSQTRKRESSSSGQLASTSGQEPPRKIRISESLVSPSSSTDNLGVSSCEICFESIEGEIRTWKCGHKICNECFQGYLVEKVSNNACLAVISCPGFRCDTILSDDEVMNSLTNEMDRKKYMQVIANEFVVTNRMLRWCSAPNCTNAIEVNDTVKQPAVRCSCGNTFCFLCSNFIHDLISCDLVKRYETLKASDYGSTHWIAKHCKPCPSCKNEIEKNGGCNHMTCRHCHHEFCWLCMEKWAGHKACSGTSKTPENASKTVARKLVACVSKHGTMIDSIKRDEQIYKRFVVIRDLQKSEHWFRVEYVKDAIDTILKCRRLLCDSFIMELFVENTDCTQWGCFTINQQDLMRATEELSHLLEYQITEKNYLEMKNILINDAAFCKGLYKAMYEIAKEGFDVSFKF